MSSKLPPIPGVVMDRETLDRLARVEQEIATFRGIRHLWANAAANHVEYIASKDDLVGEQGHRLRTVVYLALRLFTHAFPTHKSPHMFRWSNFAACLVRVANAVCGGLNEEY